MIAVNKFESKTLRKRIPNVVIVRTMKQKSSRHKYYVEETRAVIELLKEIRFVKEWYNGE